jgi:MOSC domain-containing protein
MYTISALFIYPLKSARGVPLDSMDLDERGPAGDRRWMLVDDENVFLSLRSVPRLAFVEADLTNDGLRIWAPGMPAFEVRQPGNERGNAPFTAHVWDASCPVVAADALSSAKLSEFLGLHCRLVYQPEDSIRPLPRRNAGTITEPRRLSLTDGAALLLTGESSLADLNRRLPEPVPMSRFRPNIVIRGGDPFVEDSWRHIAVGDVHFEVARGCPRCVATTVDQATGTTGVEPLRTLSRFRRAANGVLFGQNIVHLGPGRVAVGDKVSVLD